ncbi:hypothetical protein K1719_037096 [Acacia pycnantha]|nr:hypothetical protein K1719_037096 [Acacia pycnantha]
MALMRWMEITADSLYKAKLIRGLHHSYRDHCTFLGRGGTLLEVFAELMGRQAGCSKGKGGSMHFYKKENGFYGGHGIVGARDTARVRISYCSKYSKDETITFASCGDGAANRDSCSRHLTWLRSGIYPQYWCENNHLERLPRVRHITSVGIMFWIEGHHFQGLWWLYAVSWQLHVDPGSTYRTRDEIYGVRQERDPIERVSYFF